MVAKGPEIRVVIKTEEPEVELGDQSATVVGGENHGGGSPWNRILGSGSSEEEVSKPIDGFHDNGPPPFLTKSFDMVEDPEIDLIFSWSGSENSFIVWEPHAFSLKLLPKYFKHSNFSSFIRQLNTYDEQNSNLTTSETSSPDLLSNSYLLWEKLMEDDVVCDSETEFGHELVDLIERSPFKWSEEINVAEVGCHGSF